MLLVVDVNAVFSALLLRGKPLMVFELNSLMDKFEFVSPEYLFFELGKRVDKMLKYSHFSKEEFISAFSFIKSQIELFPLKSFEDKTEAAKSKLPHDKDIPYVALSFKLGCKIFSGDKRLKEALPNGVITPSEALEILLSD